jgi:threonine/homoserine/homoserine lactone efflux protein
VHLLPFLAVSAIVMVTPGVDMALVTKNALLHGRAVAQATALGVNLGILFWTLAAALGLAAVIAASEPVFTAVKLAGALYLVYLGLQALRASIRTHQTSLVPRAALDRRVALRQGLTSNLLNPKIALFFTSLLPQFVDAHRATSADLLLLGALFNGMGVVWLVSYASVAARGRVLLERRRRIKRAFDWLSGITLVALGARLAFEHRH